MGQLSNFSKKLDAALPLVLHEIHNLIVSTDESVDTMDLTRLRRGCRSRRSV